MLTTNFELETLNSIHRIMPALAKRLASYNTFYSHPCSAKRAVFFDRLACVFRAGRLKSARRRHKRRHDHLIHTQRRENQKFHCLMTILPQNECRSPHASKGDTFNARLSPSLTVGTLQFERRSREIPPVASRALLSRSTFARSGPNRTSGSLR
jgi:hypothetical protein